MASNEIKFLAVERTLAGNLFKVAVMCQTQNNKERVEELTEG